MDSFIYALVLVPSLTELLPRSGFPASPANVGFYGGLLFALFLIGWGLSLVWGPAADRFGRVRTLSLTILCYSFFTSLSALASNVWQLAFSTSFGRFVGAGATFLVGSGVARFHTIGTPVALTSLAFLVGLLLLPFGEETRGKPLPT